MIVGLRVGRWKRCWSVDASAVSLDDASRERERQAHSAAFFVEHTAVAFVCRLYGGSIADDHDGGAFTVLGFASPLGNHDARAAFFTQNGAEDGVKRGSKPCGVAVHMRRAIIAPHF